MIRLALIPTLALLAMPVQAFDGTPTPTQFGPYGGGPYRPDPRDWGPEERSRRLPPPRRGWDIPPCIRYGDCGPRRPQMPPFPDRYDLYEGEEQ